MRLAWIMFPRLLCLALCFSLNAKAQDLAAQKQKVRALAVQNAVTLQLDQPYAGNANPKQAVDLYLPEKPSTESPLPVVAFIHGGGWVNGDRIGYASAAIQMARTGKIAAVCVGYRLTGEASWPAQIHDVKAAIRWIRGHAKTHHLDPDRIAVWGSSAGGHLCSLLGTSGEVKDLEGSLGAFTALSSRVHCVVNHCGPEDFTQALMFHPEGEPNFNDAAVSGLLGGPAPARIEVAKAASPLSYVSADDPPFLTLHGTADQRVAYRHAEIIHAALQKVGVASLLIPIIGGGHGSVGHPEAKKRSEAFVFKHLLGSDIAIDTTPITALPEK